MIQFLKWCCFNRWVPRKPAVAAKELPVGKIPGKTAGTKRRPKAATPSMFV